MDFDFSEDQLMVRDSVRGFLAARAGVRTYVRRCYEEPVVGRVGRRVDEGCLYREAVAPAGGYMLTAS